MKKPEEAMEILEAFDVTGSLRGAAVLAGCEDSYVKPLLVRWWRAAADRRQGCRCAARCARPCRAIR